MESPYMRFFITSKIAERGRFFEVDRRYGLSRDYLQSFVIVSSVIIYLRYPCGLRRRLLRFVVLKFTLGNSEFRVSNGSTKYQAWIRLNPEFYLILLRKKYIHICWYSIAIRKQRNWIVVINKLVDNGIMARCFATCY